MYPTDSGAKNDGARYRPEQNDDAAQVGRCSQASATSEKTSDQPAAERRHEPTRYCKQLDRGNCDQLVMLFSPSRLANSHSSSWGVAAYHNREQRQNHEKRKQSEKNRLHHWACISLNAERASVCPGCQGYPGWAIPSAVPSAFAISCTKKP